MRISSFTSVRPDQSGTRTYESFMDFLGAKPARLGVVSTLYDQYSATGLTEALMNTVTRSNKKVAFDSKNSFMVEWDIAIKKIKRLPIVSFTGDGANKADITFVFSENYYQKHDVFVVERTRQQYIVMSRPVRVAAGWQIIAKIQDSDYSSTADLAEGDSTRFLTNFQPELHEEGYVKYQSNCEKHRAYIGTIRNDVDASAQYLAYEDVFVQIGKGDGKDPVYKMDGAQKVLIDNFMEARANACLWSKSNISADGKPAIYESETGRPIISTEGIIPQIERFATKFVFSRLSIAFFQKAIQAMVAKADKATGNQFVFIVNTLMWQDVQTILGEWLKSFQTNGCYLYSKAANDYVNVGATYHSYEWAGNKIAFKVDRCLDVEFPNRKYGFILDLTPDSNTAKPAMQFFTFKGGDFIHNYLNGVGGRDGLSSGEVSSRVAGTKEIVWGYAGVGVYNPYKSVILMSEEVKNAWF